MIHIILFYRYHLYKTIEVRNKTFLDLSIRAELIVALQNSKSSIRELGQEDQGTLSGSFSAN